MEAKQAWRDRTVRICGDRVITRDEAGKVEALEVKVGERVLFGKWSGSEVKIDGEELLIMKESDILGVVEGKE